MEITTGKVHVGSFLIGILTALMLISVYLSYQGNARAEEALRTSKANGEKVETVVKFIENNDFVKQ